MWFQRVLPSRALSLEFVLSPKPVLMAGFNRVWSFTPGLSTALLSSLLVSLTRLLSYKCISLAAPWVSFEDWYDGFQNTCITSENPPLLSTWGLQSQIKHVLRVGGFLVLTQVFSIQEPPSCKLGCLCKQPCLVV